MGGKSRKSGGVSKKLIARIKSGKLDNSCGKKKVTTDEKDRRKTLFDEGKTAEDNA